MDLASHGPLHFLVGPTASGKTELSLAVAERVGAEIVSLDSMLVYRGMDVGTAKPSPAERRRVAHHLIDVVDPPERWDLQRYVHAVRSVLVDARARGQRVLFVGGSGLYLQALTRGLFEGPPLDTDLRRELQEEARTRGTAALHARLAAVDPESAERIHANDEKRVVRALEVWKQTGRPLSRWQTQWAAARTPHRVVGLERPVVELDARIRERTGRMLEEGWIEEARSIRDGPGFGPTSSQALGYAEVLEHLDGRLERHELADRIWRRTRQFARRQRTWLRKFPELRAVPGGGVAERLGPVLDALGWKDR